MTTPALQSEFPSAAVAILLATYNGGVRLQEQLDSYARQLYLPALILVSDDNSSDNTRDIICSFAQAHPDIRVELRNGPCRGAAQNFLSLLRHVPEGIDIVALSDQDDVWLPDKIQRGVRALQQGGEGPILYCGRSWECDEDLTNRRLSRGARRPTGFRHALVQNVAGGNTMMLNHAALREVQQASSEARKVVVHDWWIYQLVTGIGGRVIFDNAPLLLYRQHGGNLIGANRGLMAKKKRLGMVFSGRFRRWNTINIQALRASTARLTPENREILEQFARERNHSLLRRLNMVRKVGLYRQGLHGNMSLYLAALMRRI